MALATKLSFTAANGITISQIVNVSEIRAISLALNSLELLYSILDFLPNNDLLHRVPRVCKGFHAAVTSSIELRRRLFRAPDFSATPQTLPLRSRDVTMFNEQADKVAMPSGGERKLLSIYVGGIDRVLDNIKHSSPGSLLLVQPPVKTVKLEICLDPDWGLGMELFLHVESGITIMHLAIMREAVRLGHPSLTGMIDVSVQHAAPAGES
ncbi:hypothetical protein LTR36_008850 [Oleoguttula mirabilis]|uniref:F-box domain-containing protein n=1 Tax=Oleoguttula mirabilis TaxID=1507867 RepID=A0AAV9J6U8_9PEZI|nr:hypothetical protein LTR36_008850 [Oleoguttula mirabilis]